MLALAILTGAAFVAAETRVSLEGYAEWRRDGVLVVDGQRVRLAEEARVEGLPFASIPLGYEVRVEGRRAYDGSVLGDRVSSSRNGSALFESQLRRDFDETEAEWLRLGRVVTPGPDGRTQSLGRLRTGGAGVARARRIAARLAPPYLDPDAFRVYVVDNDQWNAMAAPNGSIYVFRGLLRDMDDDEVAIVLGHELVHATHEHARKQQKRRLWTSLSLAGGLAALGRGSPASSPSRSAIATVAGLGAVALSNRYSRTHEDQADRVGLRYAYEAGFDATKAPELWRRFARRYGDEPAALNFFFGGHSTIEARIRNLEHEIRLNYR